MCVYSYPIDTVPFRQLEWSAQNILKTYLRCAYLRVSDCSSPICRAQVNQTGWWWHGPDLVGRPRGQDGSGCVFIEDHKAVSFKEEVSH